MLGVNCIVLYCIHTQKTSDRKHLTEKCTVVVCGVVKRAPPPAGSTCSRPDAQTHQQQNAQHMLSVVTQAQEEARKRKKTPQNCREVAAAAAQQACPALCSKAGRQQTTGGCAPAHSTQHTQLLEIFVEIVYPCGRSIDIHTPDIYVGGGCCMHARNAAPSTRARGGQGGVALLLPLSPLALHTAAYARSTGMSVGCKSGM